MSGRELKEIDYINQGKLLGVKYLGPFPKNIQHKTYWECGCGNQIYKDYGHVVHRKQNKCSICSPIYGGRGKKSLGFTGYEDISGSFVARLKAGAFQRNLSYELSNKFLWDLFIKQNKKCCLSGLDLYFTFSFKEDESGTASLDRIDSTKGYVEDNVQWVHKDINMMKRVFSDNYFIDTCIKVVDTFRSKNV